MNAFTHIHAAPAMAAASRSPTLAAIYALLSDATEADILDVLGEILDPSQGGPFATSEYVNSDLMEALQPVSAAYGRAYRVLAASVEGDELPRSEYECPDAGKRSLFGQVAS